MEFTNLRKHLLFRLRSLFIITILGAVLTLIEVKPTNADLIFWTNGTVQSIGTNAGNFSPYFTEINVTGMQGNINNIAVGFPFAHDRPQDIDMFLTNPYGQAIWLMSDACGTTPITTNPRVYLTFVDGFNILEQNSACVNQPYQTANYEGAGDPLGGAMGLTFVSSFSNMFGQSPNGVWRLYIIDDQGGAGGSLYEGWSLEIMTDSTLRRGFIDTPAQGSTQPSTMTVSGWMYDQNSMQGNGITEVRVFDGVGCTGNPGNPFRGNDTTFAPRQDVVNAFSLPARFLNMGYSVTITVPSNQTNGNYVLSVCGFSNINGQTVIELYQGLYIVNPFMSIDSPTSNQSVTPPFSTTGWAFENATLDGTGIIGVRIYQGTTCSGTLLANANYGTARPDVRNAFGLGSSYTNSGWNAVINPSGSSPYTITACSIARINNAVATSRTVTVGQGGTSPNPLAAIDSPPDSNIVARYFTVSGWAVDINAPTGPGFSQIRAYGTNGQCSGPIIGQGSTGIARPDVRAAFNLPSSFNNSGYSFNVDAAPQYGSSIFTICGQSTTTSQFIPLVTRRVTIINPYLFVDAPAPNASVPNSFTIAGWAFDNGTSSGPGITRVDVWLGGTCSGTLLSSVPLNIDRPDVRNAYGLPQNFTRSGWNAPVTIAGMGNRTFTVCAVSLLTNTYTKTITRTVNVVGGAPMGLDESLLTPTETATSTLTATATSTETATLEPSQTLTSTETATLESSTTETATFVPTDNPTDVPTETPTATVEPTATEAPTDVPTATFTPTFTPTGTPTPTFTSEPPTEVPTAPIEPILEEGGA